MYKGHNTTNHILIGLILISNLIIPSISANNINQISASYIWDFNIENGNYIPDNEVIIAIIDTGIDIYHPEFENKIWMNINEIPDNGMDDDQNGYIDDINGWNFVSNSNSLQDDHIVSHGTHTSGTIVGTDIGTSPNNTKLMILKSFDETGFGEFGWVADAIIYATNNGADVISMSLGGTVSHPSLNSAIQYANSNNVICIAAAGNEGISSIEYPARLDGVIAVGSVDSFNYRSSFSNYGTNLDIMAPGENINSSVKLGTGWKSVC